MREVPSSRAECSRAGREDPHIEDDSGTGTAAATTDAPRERRRLGRRPRTSTYLLVALVVIGAVLRFERLGSSVLDFDESFTAMVGRLPIGSVFPFLRRFDSHPPLDYLLQLPFARLGVSPFVFRLPAALCSTGALALFAWWMRDRGRVGLFATAAMAISAFQIDHAREARMYGPMELIGVATLIVADAWLRHPRPRHAAIAGALTFVGMMTHVSMALMAVGLLALAGLRSDRDAWRWRAAVVAGACGWALCWGTSFLVQARGGHSSWIPHTTLSRFAGAIASLVAASARGSGLVVALIIAGAVVCWQRDRTLGRVLVCLFALPALLTGVIGLRAPTLLPRTLTVASWGPLLAIAFLADAAVRWADVAGACAVAVAAAVMVAAVPPVLRPTGPTTALTELEHVARAGDVVAIEPPSKGIELDWTLGVRSDDGPTDRVSVPGLRDAVALDLTGRRASGRIWVMQMSRQPINLNAYRLCARPWDHGKSRMFCLRPRCPRTRTVTVSGGSAGACRTHVLRTRRT